MLALFDFLKTTPMQTGDLKNVTLKFLVKICFTCGNYHKKTLWLILDYLKKVLLRHFFMKLKTYKEVLKIKKAFMKLSSNHIKFTQFVLVIITTCQTTSSLKL